MTDHPEPDEHEEALDALLQAAFAQDNEGIVPPARQPGPATTATKRPETAGALGRYRILAELSRGGMGVVLRALDTELQREVAIKRLLATRASDEELVAQFEFEARTAARLQHPGIVPVYDFGRDEHGQPYFVMQIIGGHTLTKSDRDRDHAESLELFHRVCDTVAFAHDRGIVHGDLKPANVMIGPFNEIQVLDWGFARGRTSTPLRRNPLARDRVFGTPAYMAPEQARGHGHLIDARTDVFNLGGMLCELLTGSPPYLGDTDSDVLLRASKGWLDDAQTRLLTVAPEPLVEIVMACLATDPALRPTDAGAVTRQIRGYRTEQRMRAHDLELETAKAQAAATQARRARRLTLAWALTAVALITVAAISYATSQHNRSQRTTESTRIASDALARAELAGVRAGTGTAKLQAWATAVSSAEQAVQACASAWAPEALGERAQSMLERFRAASRQAKRELTFAHWLAEIRPHLGEDRAPAELDRLYQQAFEGFGLGTDRADTVLHPTNDKPRFRRAVTTALDEWAYVRHQLGIGSARRDHLLRLADSLDTDSLRREMRTAFWGNDLAKLQSMAKAETLAKSPAETTNLLAKFLRFLDARGDAVAVLRRGVAAHPEDFWLCHDLSALLRELTPVPWPEAIRASWMALAARPRSVHALVDVAVSLVQVGDYVAADELLGRALALAPNYPRALECAGSLAMGRADHARATKLFRRGIEADPQHHGSRVRLAKAQVEQKRLCAAKTQVDTVLAAVADHADAHALLGKIAAVRGDFEAALESTRRATELAPDSSEVWNQLGTVCYQAYLAKESVRARRKLLEQRPQQPAAMCDLGMALLRTGQLQEGLDLLQTGHEIGTARGNWPNPTDQWIYLAKYLHGYAQRLELVAAGTWRPENSMHRIGLADAALHLGEYQRAAELYAEVFASEPTQIAARGQWAAQAAGQWVAQLTESGEHDQAERLRCQAVGWLQQQLDHYRAQIASNPATAARVNQEVGPWAVIPGLTSLLPGRARSTKAPSDAKADTLWAQRVALLEQCNQILDRAERSGTAGEAR